MNFVKLAEYFERLEQTSSRLSLIDILSELFSKTASSEIKEVVYLIQGRVAPFYEATEIGMAEKTVAAAIGKAYGVDRVNVLTEYEKLGDLGKVAYNLSPKSKVQSPASPATRVDAGAKLASRSERGEQKSKLKVKSVFDTLKEIAQTQGEGTVEKKINLFVSLLKKSDSISAKHLVRVPLGINRLGIGDPTVLDAFAQAKLGDRSKRKLLEGAYNKVSDLGLIGEVLWKQGIRGVRGLDVAVGRPIKSQLAERLPDAKAILDKFGGVAHVQKKFDGFRCVGGFTPVYLKRKGITIIRDLQIGDQVLTKTGSFQRVTAKAKRTITKGEKLFKFQTYLGDAIKISEGHPLLCYTNGQEIWRNIEEVKPGDEVILPLPKFPPNNPHPSPKILELQTASGYKKKFNLNADFYRFLGFWIGDGFTNDYHNTERVGLLFNNKTEKELADSYENIIKNTLQVSKITRYLYHNCLSLYWRDEPLKEWLSTYFRREWEGKMLPEWFSHISKTDFQQFLRGWIESDGSIDKDGVAKIVTKERDLAAFAQLIGLSHGIVIGLHYLRMTYKLGKHTQNPVRKTYYQLVIPKTDRKARIEKERVIVKVFKNELIKYRDPRIQLYDIQVENDESFCVPMATLHNCQIHKNGDNVRLFSRNLEETTPMFPELISGVLSQVKAKSVILDSEALAYNPDSEEFLPFQQTSQRRRKYGIEKMQKTLPLKAFVFDIMYLNGESLIDQPLKSRMKSLRLSIKSEDTLIPQPGEIVTDVQRLKEIFDEALTAGLEGVVAKRVDSTYQAGARNFNWVKLKKHSSGELQDTVDCVILGYIFGRGKRAEFGAGALLVGVYDQEKDEFVTVSKIGTGLTDEEWREIKVKSEKLKVKNKPARVKSLITPSVWVSPKIVIEVLADEITKSPLHTAGKTDSEPGYALRFPRLVNFREADKQAEDATTVKELVELYKLQFKKI